MRANIFAIASELAVLVGEKGRAAGGARRTEGCCLEFASFISCAMSRRFLQTTHYWCAFLYVCVSCVEGVQGIRNSCAALDAAVAAATTWELVLTTAMHSATPSTFCRCAYIRFIETSYYPSQYQSCNILESVDNVHHRPPTRPRYNFRR